MINLIENDLILHTLNTETKYSLLYYLWISVAHVVQNNGRLQNLQEVDF